MLIVATLRKEANIALENIIFYYFWKIVYYIRTFEGDNWKMSENVIKTKINMTEVSLW